MTNCVNCGRAVPALPSKRSCAQVPGAWCRVFNISDYGDTTKRMLAVFLGQLVQRPTHPNSTAWAAQNVLEHLGFVTLQGTGNECRLVPTDAGRTWLEYWGERDAATTPKQSGPSFEEVRAWCSVHWGLTLLSAAGLESDLTLKPYKGGFVLRGTFPGGGHGQRWYPSLRRIVQLTEFKRRP